MPTQTSPSLGPAPILTNHRIIAPLHWVLEIGSASHLTKPTPTRPCPLCSHHPLVRLPSLGPLLGPCWLSWLPQDSIYSKPSGGHPWAMISLRLSGLFSECQGQTTEPLFYIATMVLEVLLVFEQAYQQLKCYHRYFSGTSHGLSFHTTSSTSTSKQNNKKKGLCLGKLARKCKNQTNATGKFSLLVHLQIKSPSKTSHPTFHGRFYHSVCLT